MKRIISTVLALTLMLMIPVCAFAAIQKDSYISKFTKDEIVGNIWDTDVNYRLDRKTGLLTIYGKGRMSDCDKSPLFADEGSREIGFAYYSWCNEIVDVVIENGVTDIMMFCFQSCENMKTLTIPASVKFIGAGCFIYCYSMTDIFYKGTVSQWNNVRSGVDPENEKNLPIIKDVTAIRDDTTVHIMGNKPGWVTEGGKTYYLTEDHLISYGMQKIDSKNYIFHKVTGELLKGIVICDFVRYIMSKTDGQMLYGKVRCNGKYYITSKTDGRILIFQYVSCNGKKYITNWKTGEICYGVVEFGGKTYIASKTDGHLFLNATVTCDGKTYHTNNRGAVIS